MQVRSYTFQSPYSQPTQVGRLDPSSVKEETKTQEQNDTVNGKGVGFLDAKSTKDQAAIYIQSSSMYQKEMNNDLASSLKAYREFSKDAQRSQNLNAYVNNGF